MYYKELTHAIKETGWSKTCSVGWQAADPGELTFQFQTKGQQAGGLREVTMQMRSKSHLLENPLGVCLLDTRSKGQPVTLSPKSSLAQFSHHYFTFVYIIRIYECTCDCSPLFFLNFQ